MKRPPLYQLHDLEKLEYWELIFELGSDLEERTAALKSSQAQLEAALAEIANLKDRLEKPQKTSANSSLPPANQAKAPVTLLLPAQKRGGKVGHVGQSRILPSPDQVVECEAATCSCCGADLADAERWRIGCSRIWEIPLVEPVLLELQRFERRCSCGHQQSDQYPQGYNPHQDFGPGVHALISYFNGSHHLAHERLRQMLQDVFGLEISAGALVNSLQRTAGLLEQPVQTILEAIRQSTVVGSDGNRAKDQR